VTFFPKVIFFLIGRVAKFLTVSSSGTLLAPMGRQIAGCPFCLVGTGTRDELHNYLTVIDKQI
jgi:hypothetical protein